MTEGPHKFTVVAAEKGIAQLRNCPILRLVLVSDDTRETVLGVLTLMTEGNPQMVMRAQEFQARVARIFGLETIISDQIEELIRGKSATLWVREDEYKHKSVYSIDWMRS